MKKLLISMMIIGACVGQSWASNFSLYTDKKGKQVGDVLTVIISESAESRSDTQTKTDETNRMKVSGQAGTGWLESIPGLGWTGSSDNNYNGRGRTQRNGELNATISVKIVEVLDNGNLVITGTKQVTMNQETEIIEVSGVVRPNDIAADNSLYSFKIADAVIQYSGDGELDDATSQGLVTRFFHWLF